MRFIFGLIMLVLMACVQVVMVTLNIVVAVVMGCVGAVIFIPVLLFSMWSDSRAEKDTQDIIDKYSDDDANF